MEATIQRNSSILRRQMFVSRKQPYIQPIISLKLLCFVAVGTLAGLFQHNLIATKTVRRSLQRTMESWALDVSQQLKDNQPSQVLSNTSRPLKKVRTIQSNDFKSANQSSNLETALPLIQAKPVGRLSSTTSYSNGSGSEAWPYTIRRVPANMSRFDVPWRLPRRVKTISLAESNYRILYSPLRYNAGSGLGHAMAIVNGELVTAARLGLTYTHRTAHFRYPKAHAFNFTRATLADELGFDSLVNHPTSIENAFSWGAGEIPRELVQNSICPAEIRNRTGYECPICGPKELLRRQQELKESNITRSVMQIEHVVEIPLKLSYQWPYNAAKLREAEAFLRRHNRSHTVFTMPASKCGTSPAYSKFRPEEQSYLFHKYWDAHRRDVPKKPVSHETFSSFEELTSSLRRKHRIGSGPRRPRLTRLREHELTIAIHARRGDFFQVGRPMVSTKAFAILTRRVVHEIKQFRNSTFALMPVSVSIYSEGLAKNQTKGAGHDLWRMTTKYVDKNGHVQTEQAVKSTFEDQRLDSYGNVFSSGLRMSLRTSENTVLCLHEMIAADVFLGSQSGLSMHVIAGLGRGAAQILPATSQQSGPRLLFDGESGLLLKDDLTQFRQLWREYLVANEESAAMAMHRFKLSREDKR